MLRRFGFILALALLAAVPAGAQDEKPVQINIGGGFTGIYGAAADHIGNGGNFTLGVIFNTHTPVSIQTEYGWTGIKKKEIDLPVFPQPLQAGGATQPFFADGNMQYLDVNALFHAKTSGRAEPYGVVGGGYYHRPVSITTPSVGYTTICDPWWYVCYPALVAVDQVVGERSANDFGMDFGGGVNFKMSEHASIYLEVRYHYIWGPTLPSGNVPTQPIAGVPPPTTLKANGQFLPITLGFRF